MYTSLLYALVIQEVSLGSRYLLKEMPEIKIHTHKTTNKTI